MASKKLKKRDRTALRAAIKALGGQVKTAQRLGISQSMVSHWCTGRKNITVEHMDALGIKAAVD